MAARSPMAVEVPRIVGTPGGRWASRGSDASSGVVERRARA
ncbi:MAG TPA: hypothetical protein VFR31_01170 [Thermoanaerobaculia bacterium]|nr:hypothetical protein [Thermoanaerobaculia bacterium]